MFNPSFSGYAGQIADALEELAGVEGDDANSSMENKVKRIADAVTAWVAAGGAGPVPDLDAGGTVASRAELQALTPAAGDMRTLSEAGREGSFVFRAGDYSAQVTADTRQGIYVAPDSDATGASGAWVRTGWTDIECHWFGLAADDATDDAPAINAAFAVAEALGFAVDYGWATPGVHLRMGKYYCASALTPQQTTRFYGDGGKGDAGGSATELRFPAGVHGIDLDYAAGIRSPAIDLEAMSLEGGYTDYASEGEVHAVKARVRFRARDLIIKSFQGDCFNVHASALIGNDFLENANSFVIEDCFGVNCRAGFSGDGADANAGRTVGCSFNYMRTWGWSDTSFLQNSHRDGHADGNGALFDTTCPASVVSYLGLRYCVVAGQEANASVNAPSGTIADTAYWLFTTAGGVGGVGLNIPAWVSGMSLRAGGSYYSNGANGGGKFDNMYAESAQGWSQHPPQILVVGGLGMRRNPGALWGGQFGLTTQSIQCLNITDTLSNMLTYDRLEFAHAVNGQYTLEWFSGDLAYARLRAGGASAWAFRVTGDATAHAIGYGRMVFDNGYGLGDGNGWVKVTLNAGGYGMVVETSHAEAPVTDLILKNTAGNVPIRYEGRPGSWLGGGSHAAYELQIGPAGAADVIIGDGGITLATGNKLYVGTNQVVGQRQTGWTAPTGTPARGAFAAAAAGTASVGYVQAELQTALNRIAALEARLIALETDVRTHGMIDG